MKPPAPPRRIVAGRAGPASGAAERGDGQPDAAVPPRAVAVRDRRAADRAAATSRSGAPEQWVVRPSAADAPSTRLAERLAEREGARRRVRRVRAAVSAAVVALVAALGYLALFSPVLALDAADVRVTGTETYVDPEEVQAVVASMDGTPLARLDLGALEDRIGGVEAVKSVRVARAWPRGLAVAVVAREPVAAAPRDGGYALLDAEGVRVATVPAVPAGLPAIDVPTGEGGVAAAVAVLSVLGDLPADLLRQTSRAGADSPDTVRLALGDGTTVVWGSAEASALKLRVLEVLRQRPASVYDVSAPVMPVTR